MSETLHEMAVRLHKTRCGHECAECKYRDKPCFIGVLCCVNNVDEQIENLKRWAEKHSVEVQERDMD